MMSCPIGGSWTYSTKTHKLVWLPGNGSYPDQVPGGGAIGAGSLTQQYDFFAEQTLMLFLSKTLKLFVTVKMAYSCIS